MLESGSFRCLRDGWPQVTLGSHADEEYKAARHWEKQTKQHSDKDSASRTSALGLGLNPSWP